MGHILHDKTQSLRLPDMAPAYPMREGDTVAMPEELLSALLHDLRSPLGAIGVLVDLLSATADHDLSAVELHQLSLLREASAKANRMMDDAVEIQSIIRGSSTFTLSVIEADALLRSCLTKSEDAAYFRNVQIEYDPRQFDQKLIRVDMEKAETAVLCVFEHLIHAGHASSLSIGHSPAANFLKIRFTAKRATGIMKSEDSFNHPLPMRCRLGNRRPGESHYSLQVTRQVIKLMGGEVDEMRDGNSIVIDMSFPLATPSVR